MGESKLLDDINIHMNILLILILVRIRFSDGTTLFNDSIV